MWQADYVAEGHTTINHTPLLLLFCRSFPILWCTELQKDLKTQQGLMHDLRQEKFVTQGAFMAAQLCKADQGTVKSQRGKLDLVCKLLVSAGIFEEGAGGGGLHVREREDERGPSVAQQKVDGNTKDASLEERLERAENSIARVEGSAREASEDARSAATAAAKACARSEQALTRSRKVQEECCQVEKKCRDHVDQSLEESGERIETNSTRIFHLAAEVEGLTKSMKEHGVAVRTVPIDREETGEIFSVEVADLPPEQRGREATATVDTARRRAAEGKLTPEKRQAQGAVVTTKKKKPEETSDKVETSGEGQKFRPGVLGEPWSEVQTQAEIGGTRTALLAGSLNNPASPPAWHRRHSTYIGRLVVPSERKEAAAPGMLVGPVRPLEERSLPSSWSRASSWPSLVNEAEPTTRPHDLRAYGQPNIGAEAGTEDEDRGRRGCSMMPNVAHGYDGTVRSLSLDGCAAETGDRTDETPPGTRHRDDNIAQSDYQGGGHSNHLPAEEIKASKNEQPPPSRRLVSMTANEAARALEGVAAQRRRGVPTEEGCDGALSSRAATGMETDSLLAKTGSPGARLANLGGTPVLWCPQDTWNDGGAPETTSSDGSSTVVVEGEREHVSDA